MPTDMVGIPEACTISANEEVGTDSVEALSCNLIHLDKVVNSTEGEATNRVGDTRLTLAGLSQAFGFTIIGTFAEGYTIENYNQLGQDASGNNWRYRGSDPLPVVVPAGTVPSEPTFEQIEWDAANGITYRLGTVKDALDAILATGSGVTEEEVNTIIDDLLITYSTTVQVQQIVEDSISLVNDATGDDLRIGITNGVIDVFVDFDNQENIRTETVERETLTTRLTAETNDNQAQITRVDQALTTLEGSTATQINQLQSTSNTNSAQIVNINQTVTNLSGSTATQISQLTANDNAQVNRISTVESLASGSASAISGINTAVAGTDNQSQAELLLSSTFVPSLGTSVSRAFLGVSDTTNGVSTVTGIIADSGNNILDFRADRMRLTDTAGNVRLNYNTATNLWQYSGSLSAATGTFSGSLQAATGTFSGSLSAATGTFSGSLSAATGTFSGAITASTFNGGSIDIGSGRFTVSTGGIARVFFNSLLNSGYVEMGAGFGVFDNSNQSKFSAGPDGRVTISPDALVGPEIRGVVQVETGGSRGIRSNGFSAAFYSASGGYDGGAGTTYRPFTGSHNGLSREKSEVGDIVCDDKLVEILGISDAIFTHKVSTEANDPRAIGIYTGSVDEHAHKDTHETFKYVTFNSLGEGAMNVCGQNGDILAGDLIVTSDIKGKGMKQDDNIFRSITVAKARHTITFDSPDQVKQIAVIYKCG